MFNLWISYVFHAIWGLSNLSPSTISSVSNVSNSFSASSSSSLKKHFYGQLDLNKPPPLLFTPSPKLLPIPQSALPPSVFKALTKSFLGIISSPYTLPQGITYVPLFCTPTSSLNPAYKLRIRPKHRLLQHKRIKNQHHQLRTPSIASHLSHSQDSAPRSRSPSPPYRRANSRPRSQVPNFDCP
jgi:hypothetical protein